MFPGVFLKLADLQTIFNLSELQTTVNQLSYSLSLTKGVTNYH